MDIAGATPDRFGEHQVDQLDDRGLLDRLLELPNGAVEVARLVPMTSPPCRLLPDWR